MAAATDEISLASKYTREEGRIFLNGIQALVRLPLDQHRADVRRGLRTGTFISGYPGSPLGGLDLELHRQQRLLAEHDATFTPGLNEELAATAIFGSQVARLIPGLKFDGVLGIWFGKGPGLDRAGDALKHANFAGVDPNGGALFLAGDDPSSKSSSIPSRCEFAFLDALVPVVYPGNVQEILDLGLHALMLSRSSGLVAGMKLVTNVVDGSGTAAVAPDRIQPVLPQLEVDGKVYQHQPNPKLSSLYSLEMERTIQTVRLEIARRYARENRLNEIAVAAPDAWLGIVAAGKIYYDLRQALAQLGLDEPALRRLGIRILKVGLLYPLEPGIVREFARGLEEVVVVEEKQAFLEVFVKEILYGSSERPAVLGKADERGDELVPGTAELDPDTIALALGRRLKRRIDLPSIDAHLRSLEERARQSSTRLELARTPYFCSGCPHNRSMALPEGSVAGGGIGCHGMALRMDSSYVGLTQMGGEGAQWIGIAPFTETAHLFQNLGDGTFFHSGSLAVSAAVAAGVNITYKLLYNDAVAMTGGQNVAGSIPVPELTHRLAADGVKRIIVTTEDLGRYRRSKLADVAEVWHRDRLVEAQEQLARVPGVSVLIHDQACAAELRRLRKKGRAPDPPQRLLIDERVCEGCGDCGRKSNCLSVQSVDTEFGDKTQIHQPSCNKDYSCLLGECPSFISVVPREDLRRERPVPQVDLELPEPTPRAPSREFALRMTGIGGTGVITINQILGTAALMDGRFVCGLDQTGLAQKGGPVVSDLRIGHEPLVRANKLATGEADLYLGLDLLVAADGNHLRAAAADRTVAVVSTSEVPTGDMIGKRDVRFPQVASVRQRIEQVTRAGDSVYLDAQGLAESLFGDHMPGNLLLLGLAYQLGALPVSRASIERAITLNGVGVETNLAAFAWGRLAAIDPERVVAAAREATRGPERVEAPSAEASALIESVAATGELLRLLEIRVPDLIAYQDAGYARRYVEFVRETLEVERRRAPGDDRVAIAVGRYLYKLMAYKDEYEVARLLLEGEERISEQFGSTARYAWYLHPPLLRALGLKKKIKLGRWFRPGFRLLRVLRFLRGTPLDPFGWARVRRLERRLVDEYRELVEGALALLEPGNKALVAELAALPDEIRGYEHVKLESVERYRERTAELLAALGEPLDVHRESSEATVLL